LSCCSTLTHSYGWANASLAKGHLGTYLDGMQVIPAVDVLGGRVVRLREGDYTEVTDYGSDPVAVARRWMSQGAQLVHVVDLEAARGGGPDRSLWRHLSSAGIRYQIGGGLRSPTLARAALAAGAERVVMGTAAVWEPDLVAQVGDPERVVAAVDVRGGKARGVGWTDEGRDLSVVLRQLETVGVRRLLVTGIDRDGTMHGPDLALLRRVREEAPGLAVIASGGVGTLDDIAAVAALGCEAVIVGKALYEARFELAEAQRIAGS